MVGSPVLKWLGLPRAWPSQWPADRGSKRQWWGQSWRHYSQKAWKPHESVESGAGELPRACFAYPAKQNWAWSRWVVDWCQECWHCKTNTNESRWRTSFSIYLVTLWRSVAGDKTRIRVVRYMRISWKIIKGSLSPSPRKLITVSSRTFILANVNRDKPVYIRRLQDWTAWFAILPPSQGFLQRDGATTAYQISISDTEEHHVVVSSSIAQQWLVKYT